MEIFISFKSEQFLQHNSSASSYLTICHFISRKKRNNSSTNLNICFQPAEASVIQSSHKGIPRTASQAVLLSARNPLRTLLVKLPFSCVCHIHMISHHSSPIFDFINPVGKLLNEICFVAGRDPESSCRFSFLQLLDRTSSAAAYPARTAVHPPDPFPARPVSHPASKRPFERCFIGVSSMDSR